MTKSKTTKSNKRKSPSNKKSQDESFLRWLLGKFSFSSRFKGNWFVLLGAVLLGLLFPPAMSFAVTYFMYRTSPRRPRILDRHFLVFISVMIIVSLISLSSIGLDISEVVRMTFWSTVFTAFLIYPFVFSWLWFDWEYGLNANRKQ